MNRKMSLKLAHILFLDITKLSFFFSIMKKKENKKGRGLEAGTIVSRVRLQSLSLIDLKSKNDFFFENP